MNRRIAAGTCALLLLLAVGCGSSDKPEPDIEAGPDVVPIDVAPREVVPDDNGRIPPPPDLPVDLLDLRNAPDELAVDLGTDLPVELEVSLFCEPGTHVCINETTRGICDDGGAAYMESECGPDELCDDGFCLPPICTPWELQGICVGPTRFAQCNELGTAWEAAYCDPGLTCYEGQCVDWACPPGAIACMGMVAVQACQADEEGGYAWVIVEECGGGVCLDGECISACDVTIKDKTYLGCDYWAVDLDNIESGQYQPVAVVVSAPAGQADAEITVTDMSLDPPEALSPGDLSVEDGSMTVAAGELKIFMLPTGHDLDGSSQTRRSFRVVSTAPVTVHQFNPLNGNNVFTNDASLLLPSGAMGTEYLVMSWPQRSGFETLRGFLTIVGTDEEVTKVDVWPSSPVVAGPGVAAMQANPAQPYSFELTQGDVLNLETDGAQGNDLTGTRILADRKVTVFGGHECANVPLGVNYCDHVEQQLYPLATWGHTYVGDAFHPRSPSQQDTWRILAGADNVVVTITPNVTAPPAFLAKGEWFEFSAYESFKVEATGPILVGHYLQGSNYAGHAMGCPSTFTGIGDPAFALGVPVAQFLDTYTFLTPPNYVEDYVNVISPPGVEVLLDGNPVAGGITDLGEWVVTQMPVPDGVHTVTSSEPFGLTVYGYDCDVSYAYPGGLQLEAMD